MRTPNGSDARLTALLAVAFAAATAIAPVRAQAAAESVLEIGGTFGVSGEPDNGGVALGLSLMWPIEERIRIGVMGSAEELGDAIQRLTGPGGVDLGPVMAGERYVWGGAVRIEVRSRRARSLDPFAVMTWGYYQVQDDLRGTSINTDASAGLGLGAGLLRSINPQHAIGLILRGQWLSRGEARYFSAALQWRWGLKPEGAAAGDAAGMSSPR